MKIFRRRTIILGIPSVWHMRVRVEYVLVGGILLVCIVLGMYFYLRSAHTLLDTSTVRQTSFTVYAPVVAPMGLMLQKGSTVVSDTTVTYALVNKSDGAVITVTVQPRPPSLDMRQMTEGGAVTSSILSNGTLYDLSTSGASKHLLDTGDSLVFITSMQAVNTATITALASSLKRAN